MILKRIYAYLIDYLIILIYAGLLFLLTLLIYKLIGKSPKPQGPIIGNLISFFTLTLPVFLYFYLYESSYKKATLGKQKLKLIVLNNSKKNILIRVVFKIIPWEIAHFGIHWSVFYSTQNSDIPLWNWIVLISPQVIVLIYFISIIISKGTASIYDRIAKTKIATI
ncbi:hypothetical protein D7030_02790 [Flavobacteriaceae bacterium AU392]|nr:hypothetical protein D1817_09265 [Flavobacteriaceae bacterium]RKM85616.1 hypothetical protein D7030_02790 [Flavobacteriaceae bacterium AU392]